jgi:hypothetical protein
MSNVSLLPKPRRVVRETYDIWGNSLGWVMAVVPTDWKDGPHTAIPPQAQKRFFTSAAELQDEVRRLGYDAPDSN